MLNKWKIMAYATLIKAGQYILDEKDREEESQVLVPTEYKNVVAKHLLEL